MEITLAVFDRSCVVLQLCVYWVGYVLSPFGRLLRDRVSCVLNGPLGPPEAIVAGGLSGAAHWRCLWRRWLSRPGPRRHHWGCAAQVAGPRRQAGVGPPLGRRRVLAAAVWCRWWRRRPVPGRPRLGCRHQVWSWLCLRAAAGPRPRLRLPLQRSRLPARRPHCPGRRQTVTSRPRSRLRHTAVARLLTVLVRATGVFPCEVKVWRRRKGVLSITLPLRVSHFNRLGTVNYATSRAADDRSHLNLYRVTAVEGI